jgi:excisionase family DNA binding protein
VRALAFALQTAVGSRNDVGIEMEANCAMRTREALPLLLTATETATILRTTRKAVYAMFERGLLPGVTRIGRRVLVRSADLLDFLDHNRTPSPQEYRR